MNLFQKSSLKICSAGLVVYLSLLASTSPISAANVPDKVMTPNVIKTETLGELEFIDGIPKPDTVQKVSDNLDLAHGTLAFLEGIPLISVSAVLLSVRKIGIEPGEVAIHGNRPDALPFIPTPNSAMVYALSQIDLREGSVVIDAPSGMSGMIVDAGFRRVAALGQSNSDKDACGKYLLLPPGYTSDVPDGYCVVRSVTFDHLVALATAVKTGDWQTTVAKVQTRMNIYPLALAENPPEEIFHDLLGKQFNIVHTKGLEFFKELNAVIQKEPGDAFSPELIGRFASIGIKKGRPFEPDERMVCILTEAAAIGNATALSIKYHQQRDNTYENDGRDSLFEFAGDSFDWLKVRG